MFASGDYDLLFNARAGVAMIRTKTIHKPDGTEKVVIEEYDTDSGEWQVTPGEFDDEDAADMEIYRRWLKTLP